MKEDFESKFREWWDLVWKNHIELSPGDFDCIEEIDLFLEDPDGCLSEERKWGKEIEFSSFLPQELENILKMLRKLNK